MWILIITTYLCICPSRLSTKTGYIFANFSIPKRSNQCYMRWNIFPMLICMCIYIYIHIVYIYIIYLDQKNNNGYNISQHLNTFYLPYMEVSWKGGTPKSSILVPFSIVNHPFWGVPPFIEAPVYPYLNIIQQPNDRVRCPATRRGTQRPGGSRPFYNDEAMSVLRWVDVQISDR